ncbi:hypothetical protein OESDEN_20217, partial [Oesophagostomum dentatum]
NIAQIEDGIGDKIGMLARGVFLFLSSAAFALAFSWRITLVCVGVGPVSAITMAIMSKLRVTDMAFSCPEMAQIPAEKFLKMSPKTGITDDWRFSD